MPAPATPRTRLPHQRAPALLLLLTALATARHCQHLPPRHDAFLADSLQLLRAIDPTPTTTCPQQQHAFRFPDTLLHNSHPQQAATTTLRVLQHLFSTLNSSSTPSHWDAHAHHQLLNNLHHHIHSLRHCLPDSATRLTSQGPRNLMLSINKYFTDIHRFLLSHNHSACAWDLVRLEARACFQRLHNLTRTTHK